MNIKEAKKLVATENAKKSNDIQKKRYGKNYSKYMAHIRKGKKASEFKGGDK